MTPLERLLLRPRSDEPEGDDVSGDEFARERFIVRAQALFYARLALLFIGLGILIIPAWKDSFGIESARPFVVYLLMVAYSAVNYVLLERPRIGAALTFLTLCLDLAVLVYLVVVSGGLQSPLMPTQLLYTTLFALLFPRPLAIIPPLMTFPIVAKIQEIVYDGDFSSQDVFLLIWYSAINCVIVYVVVYLHSREEYKHQENLSLQRTLKDLAVVEERTRLAREIHDGLGGTLSSMILQAEYLQTMAPGEPLRSEIGELKLSAEESMEELRRSLTLMRDDFELVRGIEDACLKFEARSRGLKVVFIREGRERKVSPEAALTLFRVLQECLANVVKHAVASRATVTLRFGPTACELVVEDDGKGFDASRPPPTGHYGLLNIHERAQRIGGISSIESQAGRGTRVSLSVPFSGVTAQSDASAA